MQDNALLIGVDIAAAEVVICGSPGRLRLTIENRKTAIAKWLQTLPPGTAIAMESTGSYHLLLATLARAAGMLVYILNPKLVWFAARGQGRRAKTDRIDAEVVRDYLRDNIEHLHTWCPGTPLQSGIEELLRHRHTLDKHRTAITMCLRGVRGLSSESKTLLDALQAMFDAIDLRVQLLMDQDEQMLRKQRLLETIVSVGSVASATMTCVFSRIPFSRSDSVIAFTGLDPRANDSGKKRGERHITKNGPSHFRRTIWLCGFAASHSRLFKPRYQALRARGISTTEAIMILGRKILRIAWAIWTSNEPFDPRRYEASTA
jgi:transposase